MKKFDGRSFVAGIVVGTLGITTAFGATSIRSASLSSRQITLKGVSLSLEKPLVEVTMDDEQCLRNWDMEFIMTARETSLI